MGDLVNPNQNIATPAQAWQMTLKELELQMTRATFQQWLSDAIFAGHAPATAEKPQTFYIRVRNTYAKDWLENRLHDTITRTLSGILDAPVNITYSVQDERAAQKPAPPPSIPEPPEAPPETQSGNNQPVNGVAVRGRFAYKNGRITQGDQFHDTSRSTKPADESEIRISGRQTDNPFDAGFIFVTNYALWFWQPYLGDYAYRLYELLDSFYHEVVECNGEWPSIARIARMMKKDRHVILGRPNSGSGGLVEILEKENILVHAESGPKHKRNHSFDQMIRLRDLPLLTPAQVATLDQPTQNEHARWMKRHARHFDIEAWESDTRQTRIEPITADSKE